MNIEMKSIEGSSMADFKLTCSEEKFNQIIEILKSEEINLILEYAPVTTLTFEKTGSDVTLSVTPKI